MTKQMTRRRFMQASAAAAVGLALESCGAKPTPESAIVPTATALPTGTSIPASTATNPPAATGALNSAQTGYSIFQGTMVDLTWLQVERAAKEGAVVLLPVAVIEEHGPHMGLGTDTYEACLMCRITRRELEARGIQALIAPPLYWGINLSTGSFPGSFSTRPETFKALLFDVLDSLRRWGLSRVFVLNAHGDFTHNRTLIEGIEEIRRALDIKAYVVLTQGAALRYNADGREGVLIQGDPSYKATMLKSPDVHAGAVEVGLMAHYYPGLVDLELAKKLPPTSGFQPQGYWGDPASYDPEESSAAFESACQASAEAIEKLVRQGESRSGK